MILYNVFQAGKAVSRRYRNRRVGEFLKDLELTEGRSTGIPTILREMAKNGSPEAVFETDNDRSYFLIRLPVHIGIQSLEQDTDLDTDLDKNTVGELLFKLLSLLKEGEKGISQLMDELAIQHKRHFRTSYIAPAIS